MASTDEFNALHTLCLKVHLFRTSPGPWTRLHIYWRLTILNVQEREAEASKWTGKMKGDAAVTRTWPRIIT